MPPASDAASPSRVSITLLMPVLNEQESLEKAVLRADRVLARLADEHEVLILNDGSTDRTSEIAERLAAELPAVRVIHNERNLNYGITLQRGIDEARCEWIVHDGADLPLAPEDFPKFIALFEVSDVIVARRESKPGYTSWRHLTSFGFWTLLHGLFRSRVDDMNFTQFFRTDLARNIRFVTSSPATTTPELILRAERCGHRVSEITADFQRREAGNAHFGGLHDISWTLGDLLRLRWHTLWHGWGVEREGALSPSPE